MFGFHSNLSGSRSLSMRVLSDASLILGSDSSNEIPLGCGINERGNEEL